MLLSSLHPDEDGALDAFETAVEALKNALKLDPENEDVKQQLIDLDVSI